MIRNILIIIFLGVGRMALAQQDPILMRVNGKEILRSEFEYNYNKDKTSLGGKQSSPDKYVERFVNSQLKVQDAEAVGLDTLLSFRRELEAYRRQLTEAYLIDEESALRMASESYNRMKDNHRSGSVRVSHIFKALPQNVSNTTLHRIETRMDSIYNALLKSGTNVTFETFVQKFSDDKQKHLIERLQMPVEFEDLAFGLQVGEISRPFFTPQGIHIVKVLERKELPSFDGLKNDLVRQQTHRYAMDKGTETFVEKLKKEYSYTSDKDGVAELLSSGRTGRTLFVLGGEKYTGKDFERFAMAHPEGVRRQLDGFIIKSVLDYENSRLEHKHPELYNRMQAYRKQLLLDKITEKAIGKQVAAKEVDLKNYFENHRSDYHWETPRYKGIVLHCATKRIAKQSRKFLADIPVDEWKNAIRLMFNADGKQQVQAEQGLFAPGDNEFVDALVFKNKKINPVSSFPFTAVVGEKKKGPDSYQEVRELLLADYQEYQEREWIVKLRASSKVEINQEVLKTVNNH